MLYLLVLFLLPACDLSSSIESMPAVECSKIGAQCQLPDGPLGVCQSSPCSDGEMPACFVCTSQH